jgi:hypothetical protein
LQRDVLVYTSGVFDRARFVLFLLGQKVHDSYVRGEW